VHLGGLIDNLLDMSRLESGGFKIQKQPVSIRDVLHYSVLSSYSLANEKGVVINEDVPVALPEVEVDEGRLKQVMLNLLGNAIKFTNEGSSITVKAEASDRELLVQVTDRGIGIPEEAMAHIFERFYQVKGTAMTGGTGLGLHISKQIIEAHDGRIRAESKLGEGSTFSFTLPLDKSGGNSHE
jgi:signal transduction histidine kinase